HPHPRFSFATALSVGVESWAEYLDMELAEPWSADTVKNALNYVLPAGVEILESSEIPLNSTSLSVIMDKVLYRVTLPTGLDLDLPARAASFLALESYPYHREKKGKGQDFDLRLELQDLRVSGSVLEMVIGRGKPLEFAAAITGLSPEELRGTRIEKLEVFFNNSPF
ncbi:MAG TPA: TIGR03936 family radical SAM-associated protein, partial [Geomobilimonas sp.]|nr:TIGR03936 family radical SAM-associated protein [Geomobilimonas sp.]